MQPSTMLTTIEHMTGGKHNGSLLFSLSLCIVIKALSPWLGSPYSFYWNLSFGFLFFSCCCDCIMANLQLDDFPNQLRKRTFNILSICIILKWRSLKVLQSIYVIFHFSKKGATNPRIYNNECRFQQSEFVQFKEK